jgi:hypothetical protein
LIEIENELLILERYNLTAEEWFVLRLLILASVDEGKDTYIKQYMKLPTAGNLRDILVSLQNKSVILKTYKIPNKGEKFNPEDVDLNKNFMKAFYKCSGVLGKELFEEYPATLETRGKLLFLNNITKGYKDMEELCFDYGRIIKFNPETHKEVMELLKFGKENNLICYGIVEFIKSYKWLTIKKMKEDGSYVGMSFDNITSI